MDFSRTTLTDEQRAFLADVRATFSEMMTDEVIEHERTTGDGYHPAVHHAMATKGWLVPDWSVEEGGAGLDLVCQRLLELEILRFGVPRVVAGTTRMAWLAVAQFATPEILQQLRAGVADGSVRICLGYTEPEGGSDIAAARVRATRRGDDWVIKGSKIFTTGAHKATHIFLLARTDSDASKHHGLTMFLVPTGLPGIEIQAVHTFGGERTNIVYFDDAIVSGEWMLGKPGQGWAVLSAPLSAEHSTTSDPLQDASFGRWYLRSLETALDDVVRWAAETEWQNESRRIDDPVLRFRLGRIRADIEAAITTPGAPGRIAGSEVLIQGAAELMDILGSASLPVAESAVVSVERAHRWAQGTATYGGTVEVFRNTVALVDLGLPRPLYPDALATGQ